MTTAPEPTDPLPGLPETPKEERPLTDLEVCTLNLQASVVDLCASALRADTGVSPADVAGNIGSIIGQSLLALMDPRAARLGVLVAFEGMHAEPMTFIDINHAKQALEKLSDRRRRADKTTAGGIIIPGKD